MEPNAQETHTEHPTAETVEALPFPFNQQTFCRYESIEKTIDAARVLIVDNLLRDADDLSQVARREWGKEVNTELKREREIASLALRNIVTNIERLVKEPTTKIGHLSEIAAAAEEFKPDAVVLSGTLFVLTITSVIAAVGALVGDANWLKAGGYAFLVVALCAW